MAKTKTEIPRFALAGGPCSGKTSGLARLMQKLPEYGVTPFAVPEIATLLFGGGFDITKLTKDKRRIFNLEAAVAVVQIELEAVWEKLARQQPAGKKVILCDRGLPDIAPFVTSKQFFSILANHGLTPICARDDRYDAVFFMRTAADGREKFYHQKNAARSETPNQARMRDEQALRAWNGHEHLRVIGNFADSRRMRPISFKEKLRRLEHEVCRALGIPAPLEIERWFLVDSSANPKHFPVQAATVAIRQTYLRKTASDIQRRIRARAFQGDALYVYTEKQEVRPGVRIENERIISQKEYLRLLAEADPKRREVIKKRVSFVWRDQYFQLDFISLPSRLVKLEAELTKENTILTLPPFLNVIREVTDDDRFSNSSIAAGECPGYKK